MSQQDHGREFLLELHDRLVAPIMDETSRAHVRRAAQTAVATRRQRRSQVVRLGLTAVALSTAISTSGVAVAGSLPAPVQGMVADAARLLPVPIPIPYPAAPALEQHSEPVLPPIDLTSGDDAEESATAEAPRETAKTLDGERAPAAPDGETTHRDHRNHQSDAELRWANRERGDHEGGDDYRDRDRDHRWDEDHEHSDSDESDRDHRDGDDWDRDDWDRDDRDRGRSDRDDDWDRDDRDRDHADGGDSDDTEQNRDFRNQHDRSDRDR